MNLMITGGLGFIGFNFVQYLKGLKIKDLNIKIFDKFTYAVKPYIEYKHRYCIQNKIDIVIGDICNQYQVNKFVKECKIDGIINFAAQTHVDNSINNPNIFINVNVLGTANLLETCRNNNIRFHQISTDQVYGSIDPKNDIVDYGFKYNPSSPYSSSKASADLICLSYYKTFGTKVTISRCTNNYGKYQHQQKLIPKVINNFKKHIDIPVYGNGLQMMNWIHVKDHCDAIWKIFNNGRIGQVYNIGSDTLITNIELIQKIMEIMHGDYKLIKFVKDRPAHDICYHLNCDKIKNELNWEQKISFKEGINELVKE